MVRYSLGLDFGTASVRALLVDVGDGRVAAVADWPYRRGTDGVIMDAADPDLSRQHPADYVDGLRAVVRAAVGDAGVDPADVVGIGDDATASTPIPVDAALRPLALALHDGLGRHPAAMAWLWKDHTAAAEAAEITALAGRRRPAYLARCGGTYSSEWFWAKALRCARAAPEVFAAASSFVELCDWVPGYLTGVRSPRDLPRSVCAAGHKGLYAREWGGPPDAEFLAELAPELARLLATIDPDARAVDRPAGRLDPTVAAALGLRPGTPVAVGSIDAHLGAVGAGIDEGDVVKVLGTSSCDMAVARLASPPDAPGLCGVVPGSILPGLIGFEAGQSAVGDLFAWCQKLGSGEHTRLTADAAGLRPGQSGLLALDWHNGNRCVLVDPALSGLIVGLHLQTRLHEVYRAMIEATAFGARIILDRLVEVGVPVRRVIACGGIAARNDLVLQVYADVLQRPVHVAGSEQTCALGAAITGAVAGGAFASITAAQAALCPPARRVFAPSAAAGAVYDELFGLYRTLHDAFGTAGDGPPVAPVMKRLLAIRDAARGA